jgi:hypothetical protein
MIDQGAAAVIASLWGVEDESAFRLTQDLYTEVQAYGAVKALAKVQKRWSKEQQLANWAGYTLYAFGVSPRPGILFMLRALVTIRLVMRRMGARRSKPTN